MRKQFIINSVIAFLFVSFCSFESLAQKKDTFHLPILIRSHINFGSSYTQDTFRINDNEVVDKETYLRFVSFNDSIWVVLDSAADHYCRFYNEDNILVEEGIWNVEFWVGPYKKYFDNGVLKIEGQFSALESTIGKREGIWKYYKTNGTLDYQEVYKMGKVVKVIESN